MQDIFQVLEEENYQAKILYLAKMSFRNEREIRTFSDEGKLRDFVTGTSTPTESLKEFL